MAKLKLSPPWDIYYRKVNAMFEYDREVKVVYDEENLTLKLYVDDSNKADALSQLLPTEKKFGNVTLHIEVVPSNKVTRSSSEELYLRALNMNMAMVNVKEVSSIPGLPTMTFVIFAKKVVQFYTDNLCDINGFTSTLYQDIAKDIFIEKEGVYFCTDTRDPYNDYPTPVATCGGLLQKS